MNTFFRQWIRALTFPIRYFEISITMWVAFTVMLALISSPFMHGAVSFSLTAAFVIVMLLEIVLFNYEAQFDRRISSRDYGCAWFVFMNGVLIGKMSDHEYASIKKAVFFDLRVYWSQLLNIWHVAKNLVRRIFYGAPPMFFWLALATFVFSPQLFNDVVIALAKLDSNKVAALAATFKPLLFSALVIYFGIDFCFGNHGGLHNCFSAAVADQVRCNMSCVVKGDMVMTRAF